MLKYRIRLDLACQRRPGIQHNTSPIAGAGCPSYGCRRHTNIIRRGEQNKICVPFVLAADRCRAQEVMPPFHTNLTYGAHDLVTTIPACLVLYGPCISTWDTLWSFSSTFPQCSKCPSGLIGHRIAYGRCSKHAWFFAIQPAARLGGVSTCPCRNLRLFL